MQQMALHFRHVGARCEAMDESKWKSDIARIDAPKFHPYVAFHPLCNFSVVAHDINRYG